MSLSGNQIALLSISPEIAWIFESNTTRTPYYTYIRHYLFMNLPNTYPPLQQHMQKQESDIQTTLEELYINMSQESFKDLRRILPVTKTKMEWNGAAARLADMAGSSKPQKKK